MNNDSSVLPNKLIIPTMRWKRTKLNLNCIRINDTLSGIVFLFTLKAKYKLCTLEENCLFRGLTAVCSIKLVVCSVILGIYFRSLSLLDRLSLMDAHPYLKLVLQTNWYLYFSF